VTGTTASQASRASTDGQEEARVGSSPAASELLLPVAPPSSVLVVGTGLMGTSVGLALRARGVQVWLSDIDQGRVETAMDIGAGEQWVSEVVDHVVLAIPGAAVAHEMLRLLPAQPKASFSDIAAVKFSVQRDIETLGGPLDRFVGGHPMAGRELEGPEHADAELFVGRPWALCATSSTTPTSLAATRAVVQLCGAVPVFINAERHDASVALLSHLPQLTASALSALAVPVADAELRLAGQGWRDMTRIADSPADLWAGIVVSNAAALRAPLTALIARLQAVLQELPPSAHELLEPPAVTPLASSPLDLETQQGLLREHVLALVAAGNSGRRRLPDKDAAAGRWDRVLAAVADRPGELARLLLAAGAAGVNVEDLHVEHQATHRTGEVTLYVQEGAGGPLGLALQAQGWRCRVEPGARGPRSVAVDGPLAPGGAESSAG